MKTIERVDQLRCDPNAIPFSAQTALENILDIKLVRDFADVRILAFKRKGRRARYDPQTVHFRQRIENLFADAVAKILLIFRLAHIDEWQHRNGFFVGGGRRRRTRNAWRTRALLALLVT